MFLRSSRSVKIEELKHPLCIRLGYANTAPQIGSASTDQDYRQYVLGDPMAPWFGGSASLTSALIKKNPEAAKKFITAYSQGVAFVRSKPAEARQYLKGYTAIEGPLTGEVPLAAYTLYNEFTPGDIAYFQKFFDLFSDKGIFSSRLMVDSMLYKG